MRGLHKRRGNVASDYEERVRASFARQAVMRLIGASITQVELGQVTIELLNRPELTQQHGFLHAGIVTMLVDNACGYSALTMMPTGAAVLTVEYKVNFLAPATGERLVARGRVIKPGQTLSVCLGEAYVQRDGEEKLVATMLATMITRLEKGMEG
jgi:uncharacterized protein (TIGR00369 family)